MSKQTDLLHTTHSDIAEYAVDDLQHFPQWVEQLALWHHDEWRKGQLLGPLEEKSGAGNDLDSRKRRLAEHTCSFGLPSTFVAHHQGEPIGSVSVVLYRFTGKQQPSPWLTNLFVVEHHRQQGVGQRLMAHALAYAEQQGLKEIKLFTREQAAYYQKRGWQRRDRARVQQREVDILVYSFPGADGNG